MEILRLKKIGFAIALFGLAACGSRSQLQSPPEDGEGGGGAGGTGGATTTSTTSTSTSTTSVGGGGAGGTGGGPIGPCENLGFVTPFARLDGGVQSHQRSPKLGFSTEDKLSVTIASAWQAADNPGPNAPIELRHTTLEPWIDFPAGSGLGPTYLADLDAGVSFSIAQGVGKHFALLYRDFQQPPQGGQRFSADFVPKSGTIPPSVLVDSNAEAALFLRRNGSTWAFGTGKVVGDLFETRVGITDPGGAQFSFAAACTTERVPSDAVATQEGFLVAVPTTSASVNGCDVGIPSSPSGPLVLWINGPDVVPTSDFGFPNVRSIQMAPRSDGAWLVWVDPFSEDKPAQLVITALDPIGLPLIPPFNFSGMQCEGGSLSIASFDDFLAVACIVSEPEGASPYVQVFDPSGEPRGSVKVFATGAAKGRAAIIGSPISRALVLAWSETAAVGDQIRITRVECLDES